ncbi:cellulase family glycosylhydrolase [Caballeronia sp. J97]|uniref:cellulase family glycosylhydrolase n=1 Tax=Caballeronia sp. J97 TaxID=2805429 RepID=UPI002AAF7C31|nr:cellulase family glycosylhydrolase [Caballeronia sp. J97]
MIVGVGIHRAADPGFQGRTLPMASNAGMRSIRMEVHWSDVEKSKGAYTFPASIDQTVRLARELGLEPLMILDYGNPSYDDGRKPVSPEAVQGYARYAEALVRHFGDKIRYYEIWNEWDNGLGGTEPGRVDDYAALVKAAYPAIKKIRPDSIVLVGGVTEKGLNNGWYERLAQLGALRYADGLSVHPYGYHESPVCAPEHAIGWLDSLESVLSARFDIRLPVYVTEVGWPTNQGKFGVTESMQAEMLRRFFALAADRPYIKGIWWYDLVDDANNPADKEANFGLLHFSDLSAKPAWQEIANLQSLRARAHGNASIQPDRGTPDPAATDRGCAF